MKYLSAAIIKHLKKKGKCWVFQKETRNSADCPYFVKEKTLQNNWYLSHFNGTDKKNNLTICTITVLFKHSLFKFIPDVLKTLVKVFNF